MRSSIWYKGLTFTVSARSGSTVHHSPAAQYSRSGSLYWPCAEASGRCEARRPFVLSDFSDRTPRFFVAGLRLPVPYQVFRPVLDRELTRGGVGEEESVFDETSFFIIGVPPPSPTASAIFALNS